MIHITTKDGTAWTLPDDKHGKAQIAPSSTIREV